MAILSSLIDNCLLDALAPIDCTRFRKDLELVDLQSQQYLDKPNVPVMHVFFPTTSIISLMCLTDAGVTVEVGLVGREGIVGASFMGGSIRPVRAVVQRSGLAYRLTVEQFKREFDRNAALQRVIFLYTQALLTQVAQSVLCTRCHSIDQHLCRWLLNTLDRMSSDELTITHESIANMLGVRRESVTASAGKLKSAGLISMHRGHIKVLDRVALEGRACECYQIVKKEFEGLLRLSGATPDSDMSRSDNRHAIYKRAAAYQGRIVSASSSVSGGTYPS